MNNKKRRIFWYCIAIGFIILFMLILLSSILNIGDRLRSVNKWLEYTFYAVSLLLVWFLIINPIRIIVFSPSLSIVTTLEKDSFKAHQTYKAVTKNILKSNGTSLTKEEKDLLTSYTNYQELHNALELCMNNTIKKQIKKVIIRNAKTVMLSTAISQNSKLDMYSVVVVDLKMIKEIVCTCGFRPSMKNLSKLTVKVASTALIADGLESLNIDEILPNQVLTTISNVPLLKPILSSFIQGVTNALMTIRIGLVTRGYLFSDSQVTTQKQIRIQAYKDAVIILPLVIAEVLAIFPNKVVRFFGKKSSEKQEIKIASNPILE